jgi:hypothetical protein
MKKFIQEVLTYFWIPLIMGIVSYVFFQLRDVTLGVSILIALSAAYTLVRLYFLHRKWWLIVILAVVVMGSAGYFITRSPASALAVNDVTVTGSTVNVNGGSVTVMPTPQNNSRYVKGTKVTLTARPASGYDWKSWTGTDNDAANPVTVVIKGNTRLTVNFESRASLIINNQSVIGSVVSFPEGSVTVSPVPGDDGKYSRGTVVTLTAVPESGYGWKSWSGTGSDTANPAKVTITSEKHVTVTFELRFLMTINNQAVTSADTALKGGTVSVNPSPGADGRFARNATALLTAVPAAGYRFDSWGGDVSGNVSSITTMINANKNITASFIKIYGFTASVSPAGGGIVSPAGGTYDSGSNLTVNAVPAAGYRFDRWSGDAAGNVASIVLNMNTAKNVTAFFVPVFKLTASVSPAGGGSVIPGTGSYDAGANVTLTAVPAPGYRFDHWSGDVSGNLTTTSITIDAASTVTANFIRVYTLTVSVSPDGGGTVSVAGGTYDAGASVTLTTAAAAGYVFDHWEGDVSGNTASVTVTMTGNKNVMAVFKNVP